MNAVKCKYRNYELPIPKTKQEIILFLQVDNKEIKQLNTWILQLWRNAQHKLQLTQHGKDNLNSSITIKKQNEFTVKKIPSKEISRHRMLYRKDLPNI